MQESNIEILIEKYIKGMTTLEEEESIRQAYIEKKIPDKYIEYLPLFSLNNFLQNYSLEELMDKCDLKPKKSSFDSLKVSFIQDFWKLISFLKPNPRLAYASGFATLIAVFYILFLFNDMSHDIDKSIDKTFEIHNSSELNNIFHTTFEAFEQNS